MMKRSRWILVGLTSLSTALAIYIAIAVYGMSSSFQSFEPITVDSIRTVISEELNQMQQVSTTWKDAQNNSHTVTTVKTNQETFEEFATRHHEAVDALQKLFPPVGQ